MVQVEEVLPVIALVGETVVGQINYDFVWQHRCGAASYLRLLRGDDDADRLFFERALVMEGDTEYGLLLKNTLDAIGPLLHRPA